MDEMFPDEGTLVLDLVAFKWMMAGQGWRVDVTRMRRDVDYACDCAARGLKAGPGPLKDLSATLLRLIEGSGRVPTGGAS